MKRKILKVDELPKGFYYFTEDYMVEGTGKKCDVKEQKHEGLCKKKRK